MQEYTNTLHLRQASVSTTPQRRGTPGPADATPVGQSKRTTTLSHNKHHANAKGRAPLLKFVVTQFDEPDLVTRVQAIATLRAYTNIIKYIKSCDFQSSELQ